jgi:predicted Zn finger-like uncharacterized protein
MTIRLSCPSCEASFQVREEYAGKRMKCPKCSAVVTVPSEEPAAEEAIQPTPAIRRAKDEDPVLLNPEEEEELEDEDVERRRSKFKPCPRCRAWGAKRVVWTPWGSFYGPAMFTHVRCPKCGYGYNGKTGGSNLIPAIIFVTVPAIGICLILVALAWVLYYKLVIGK